jgi:hypothetical protein
VLAQEAGFDAGDPTPRRELACDDGGGILSCGRRVAGAGLPGHVGQGTAAPVPDVQHGAGTETLDRGRQSGDPHAAPVFAVRIDVDADLTLQFEDGHDSPVLVLPEPGVGETTLGMR